MFTSDAQRLVPRRRFLKGALATLGASCAVGGSGALGRVLGANETIRVGVAGLNGRGGSHVGAFAGMSGVEVAYLIDPDTRTFAGRVRDVEKRGGRQPETLQDIRRALERKDLDVVTVATTNHWHAPITIWACQAEKDVYVEKPLSHNVREGRIAADVAREHGRVVQHGTQSRSSSGWARVVEVIRSGKLGKLLVSRGLCYKPRGSIGFKEPSAPPRELDFNLWLGPAPEQPHHANLVHYNWHWFWDFGNGDIGNQGVHQIDLARWAIPGATLPRSVVSFGGRFGYKDQGQTANSQVTVFDFDGTQLVFEVRGLSTSAHLGEKVGNIFHLEAGTIAGQKFYPQGSDKAEPLPKVDGAEDGAPRGGHFENFIAAVRSRKASDLHAGVLEGHYSSAICHLANISYRLGAEVPFAPKSAALRDNKDACEALDRMEEHLRANGVELVGSTLRVGRHLKFDGEAEKFIAVPEADELLTRRYREPFTLAAGPETQSPAPASRAAGVKGF